MIWFIRHWTTLIGAQFARCKLRLAPDSVKWKEKSETMVLRRRLLWGAAAVSFACIFWSMPRQMINWVAVSWHLCCDLLAMSNCQRLALPLLHSLHSSVMSATVLSIAGHADRWERQPDSEVILPPNASIGFRISPQTCRTRQIVTWVLVLQTYNTSADAAAADGVNISRGQRSASMAQYFSSQVMQMARK